MKEKYYSINSMKFLCAFFVICIHKPFYVGGDLVIAISKIAVPFFLLVSGFFTWKDTNEDRDITIKKHMLRIFKLIIFSNTIYFIFNLALNIVSGSTIQFIEKVFSIKSLLIFLLFNESPVSAHLWFLGSLLYVYVIVYILNKLNLYKKAFWAIPFLYIIYVILGRYSEMPMYMYRNCVLCSLPYFLLGSLLNKIKYKFNILKNKHIVFCIGISLIITISEYLILNTTNVPYINTIFLLLLIGIYLINNPTFMKNSKISKWGEKYSLYIYIYHIIIIYIFNFITNKTGTYDIYKYFAPIVILFVTLFISIIGIKFLKKRKRKKNDV